MNSRNHNNTDAKTLEVTQCLAFQRTGLAFVCIFVTDIHIFLVRVANKMHEGGGRGVGGGPSH